MIYEAIRNYWEELALERRTFTKGGRTYVESIKPHHDYKGWFFNHEDKKMYRWNDLMDTLTDKKRTDLWYGINEDEIEDESCGGVPAGWVSKDEL
jgi:hypothetical protein